MSTRARMMAMIAGSLLMACCGCALTPKSQLSPPPPLSREQADWWEANKARRQYVAGKGWYVPGTSGFFDDSGRKITSDFVGDRKYDEPVGFMERISPKKAWTKSMMAIGQGPNEKVARAALAEGDDLFRQKSFAEAGKKYRQAYKKWPDSPLEEEALFKCAESEFFADRYAKADDEFSLLIKKFPSTQYLNQVITRRFSIARYWDEYDREHPHWPITPNLADRTRPAFDTLGHAIRIYQRNRLDDPTGQLADDNVMATANANFLRGHYDDADYYYGILRTEYPRSDFQYQAHLLGLRCKLLLYQGPGYDTTPLEDAEKLTIQLLTQFPKELGESRDEIVRVRGEIRHEQAKCDLELAQFYDAGEHYGASRIFYEKIVKDYPDTEIAQHARTQLDDLAGLPNHPTPPFQWLVDMLPESKQNGPIVPKGVETAGKNKNVK